MTKEIIDNLKFKKNEFKKNSIIENSKFQDKDIMRNLVDTENLFNKIKNDKIKKPDVIEIDFQNKSKK